MSARRWPDEIEIDAETALVSLVHEERLDIPALRAAVEGGAFYVGALGSRRAQAARARSSAKSSPSRHGPVGLDLGGETPAEIALKIVAEILAALEAERRRPSRRVTKPRPIKPTPRPKCSQLSA